MDDGYTSFTITLDSHKCLVNKCRSFGQQSISDVPLDNLETEEPASRARYSTGRELLLKMDIHHSVTSAQSISDVPEEPASQARQYRTVFVLVNRYLSLIQCTSILVSHQFLLQMNLQAQSVLKLYSICTVIGDIMPDR